MIFVADHPNVSIEGPVDLHRISDSIIKLYTENFEDIIMTRSSLLREWLGNFSWKIEGELMSCEKDQFVGCGE